MYRILALLLLATSAAYPAEKVAAEQVHASGDEHLEPPIVKELKRTAEEHKQRRVGLAISTLLVTFVAGLLYLKIRQIDRASALPFASPSGFVMAQSAVPEAQQIPAGGLAQSTAHILEAAANRALVDFYGVRARDAYVSQPAAALVRTARTQSSFATGLGIVAIIDTGVDPNHPVLSASLVDGYDFTRDLPGIPNEIDDLTQSTAHILEQSTAHILEDQTTQVLNGSALALLDQSTAHVLEGTPLPSAFGHGTMVAGIVHLVAPSAKIMPLKAFNADGTTDLFRILRAIYYATDHGAHVINMSFSLPDESSELRQAIEYADRHGVLCVAASGNEGLSTKRYPASFNNVVGVGSNDLSDRPSIFSNRGSGVAALAAPGEEIITTYPAGLYAAGWGTSFSAPFVAGAAALLNEMNPGIDHGDFANALSHGVRLSDSDFGWGRVDTYSAVSSRVEH